MNIFPRQLLLFSQKEEAGISNISKLISQSLRSYINKLKYIHITSGAKSVYPSSIKAKLVTFLKKKLKLIITTPCNYLNTVEARIGYFLPYSFSQMRKDDFFHLVERIAREENINTTLILGASSGKGITEAFLTGIQDKY